ncbi:hypothetical protein BC826DRAFT_967926 [Russula brevipes]|nr:hypothetical protein BC826DRAFT_967926 [Russula brevipes]
MSTTTDMQKCPRNPSTRLTADNNAAQPALPSHRKSVAITQAQQALATAAAEAKQCLAAPSVTVATTDAANQPNRDGDHLDSVTGPSKSPLPTPTTTSPAVSQPGSVPPPATAPPSESENELNGQSTTVPRKGKKQKWHDSAGETASTDKNGMYEDVVVLDIDSDSTDPENKNKRNPKADIEHFFEPAKLVKGDKKGRQLCKTCA